MCVCMCVRVLCVGLVTALFEAAPNRTCVVHVCVCACYVRAGCQLASDESRKSERRGLSTSPVDKDFLLFSQLFTRARSFCLTPITPSQRWPNVRAHTRIRTHAQMHWETGTHVCNSDQLPENKLEKKSLGYNTRYSKGVRIRLVVFLSTGTEESPFLP